MLIEPVGAIAVSVALRLRVLFLWYALPLIVSISLVYGATRHELPGPILEHAIRFGLWIVGFMLIIIAILSVVSWYC